jgi:hypothetical protein
MPGALELAASVHYSELRIRCTLSEMTTAAVDPADYIRELGQAGDGPHDIARAAVMLSALDHAGRALDPYFEHLADIAEHARMESRIVVSAEDGARSLAALLVGRYAYDGDRLSYDDPNNADFLSVVDRRRGLPVALGILTSTRHARPVSRRSASTLPGIFCCASA